MDNKERGIFSDHELYWITDLSMSSLKGALKGDDFLRFKAAVDAVAMESAKVQRTLLD